MKIFYNKLFGGILLISGTTIGVGMLAFPVVTAFGGFFPSLILFFLIWFVMLCSAYFFLDVNLSLQGQVNMVTMAQKTLGIWGKSVSWIVYLLLLYSLTAAYIAGCTPLFIEAIQLITGFTLPLDIALFLLPVIFGGFIYLGTKGVDLVNRILMMGLIIAYIFLVFYLPPHVQTQLLVHMDFSALVVAIPVIVTAFGYHVIIPSLVNYMQRDAKKLRLAILIGSLIPIIVYLLWQILILGTVPIPLLAHAFVEGEPAVHPLTLVLKNPSINLAAKLFSFFAIITSFIGVSLSLSDFLIDGFRIKRTWEGRLFAVGLTFIPPIAFIFVYQRGFYLALEYAGAFVGILLIFLPAAMAWTLPNYRRFWKRIGLITVMVISLVMIILNILQEQGTLKHFIVQYLS